MRALDMDDETLPGLIRQGQPAPLRLCLWRWRTVFSLAAHPLGAGFDRAIKAAMGAAEQHQDKGDDIV